MYNIDTQEQAAVHICGFDGIRRRNYFGEELIGRAEVEMRLGKLKNGKASGKDEITEEMIKGGGDRVVDWTLRVVVCLNTGDLLRLFHCTRIKERGLNARSTEVLDC